MDEDLTKTASLTHSPDRAARRIGLPLRSIYALIATGDLRSFKVGKRRCITEAECLRFVGHMEAKTAAATKAHTTPSTIPPRPTRPPPKPKTIKRPPRRKAPALEASTAEAA
ncbi:MAG: hypothetical protein ABI601_21370 [bacterium]